MRYRHRRSPCRLACMAPITREQRRVVGDYAPLQVVLACGVAPGRAQDLKHFRSGAMTLHIDPGFEEHRVSLLRIIERTLSRVRGGAAAHRCLLWTPGRRAPTR